MPKKMPEVAAIEVNEFQKTILRKFGMGDYAHLAEINDWRELQAKLEEKVDGKPPIFDRTLLALLIDFATEEGCEDLDTALERIRDTRQELAKMEEALLDMALPTPGARN